MGRVQGRYDFEYKIFTVEVERCLPADESGEKA
jgi:hypothetical protein